MATATRPRRTANDRFKASFWSYVWAASTLSALAHFALLHSAEFGGLPDYSYRATELEQVELHEQADFEIPPPPEQIARPAVPVLSTDVNISSDITIAEVDFNEFAVAEVPPPPAVFQASQGDEPAFTPYEIRPTLLNGRQLQEVLLTYYPPAYKTAGIGGITVLWIYIDAAGQVQSTKVVTSSGYAELDAVAERVVREAAKFSPAYNRDVKVPVWIQMPVTFEARTVRSTG
ncbi:MAG TPA: energy transducer TonB [Longimicrobiaceae bacterium]|nr:energy transducer TonB [Longimicrobiaceae bacterium]